MISPDVLKRAQEEMDYLLFTYLQDKPTDSELRKNRIDNLTRATIQFLKLREEVDRGRAWV
jgi:hypothetical protein